MSFRPIAATAMAMLAAAASPTAALAATAPRLVPARDVTVTYQVALPNQSPLELRIAIAAGGTPLRIVGDELPTSFLVDRQSETAAIILPMLKTYTRVSIARYDPTQTVLKGAGFVRGDRDEVAGLGCRHWHARAPHGTADACVTDDGVILEGSVTSDRKGTVGTVRALRVNYGRLPPEIFAIPSNYSESPLGQVAAGFMK